MGFSKDSNNSGRLGSNLPTDNWFVAMMAVDEDESGPKLPNGPPPEVAHIWQDARTALLEAGTTLTWDNEPAMVWMRAYYARQV